METDYAVLNEKILSLGLSVDKRFMDVDQKFNYFNESMVGRFTELNSAFGLTFEGFNKRLDEIYEIQNGIPAPIQIPVDATRSSSYGILGNGSDETLKIQKFFDEQNILVFDQKSFKTSAPIIIKGNKQIYFNGCSFYASTMFETFLQLTGKIDTHGTVYLDGSSRVTNGMTVVGGGRSHIDSVRVTKCRVWGIFVDREANNNLLFFNQIGSYQNGTIITAKASKGISAGVMELTGMDCKGWEPSRYNTDLINNKYSQFEFIVDATGYSKNGSDRIIQHRRVFMTDYFNSQEGDSVIQGSDERSATVRLRGMRFNNVNDDYIDKDVQVLIGGGMCFYKKAEGAININQFGSSSNPVGMSMGISYGGFIGNFVSQFDNLMIGTDYVMGLSIGHLYMEATSPKLVPAYEKRILLCTFYEKTNIVAISSIGDIKEENIVVVASTPKNYPGITILQKHVKKFMSENTIPGYTDRDTYTERDNRDITHKRSFHSTVNTINLDLTDVKDVAYNGFAPLRFYYKRDNETGNINISISEKLKGAGYTLRGSGVDGKVSIPAKSPLPEEFKITIILFDKEFVVIVEALNIYQG